MVFDVKMRTVECGHEQKHPHKHREKERNAEHQRMWVDDNGWKKTIKAIKTSSSSFTKWEMK